MRKLARISITLGWIVLLTGGNAVWAVEASGPVQLDQRVQLFIDDFLIERTERVWRTLNRSRKVPENPIIKPDRPWEGYLVLQPGSVIYDPNKRQFQMWYNTLATESDSDIEQFLCYATSQDGIRWEKPELGLVDFRGSNANNIVLRWCNWDHSVIRDPEDPDPNRLYKMVYWQTHDRDRCGIWSAFSPDGIRWSDSDQNPVVPCWASGDTFSVMKDPVFRSRANTGFTTRPAPADHASCPDWSATTSFTGGTTILFWSRMNMILPGPSFTASRPSPTEVNTWACSGSFILRSRPWTCRLSLAATGLPGTEACTEDPLLPSGSRETSTRVTASIVEWHGPPPRQ